MKNRAHQMIVCALLAMFVASSAGPGLVLHNCRHFGTRSTKLCDCCEAELTKSHSCCAAKNESEQQPVTQHDQTVKSPCCFVSFEGPFDFDGQGASTFSLRDIAQVGIDLAPVLPATIDFMFADLAQFTANSPTQHSADPPSYILTHSFRC